jgi:hypothetical protein
MNKLTMQGYIQALRMEKRIRELRTGIVQLSRQQSLTNYEVALLTQLNDEYAHETLMRDTLPMA